MRFSALVRLVLGSSILLFGAYALAIPQAGAYRLLKKLPFSEQVRADSDSCGSNGASWGCRGEYYDYITIDPDARRVYLSHGIELKVLDADSFAEVGTITGLKQMHGTALAREFNRGFISDGGADRAVIFDLRTLKTIGEVKTGRGPDTIVYDPASKHILTFNGGSHDMTVIDPARASVIATLPLGGQPEQAVADGNGMIYNNIVDMGEVVAIDSRALEIKARWSLAPAGRPFSIGMDRQHRRLFIGTRTVPTRLLVMNADNGKIIQSLPIAEYVDTTVYDPGTGLVASSTRNATIHLFHEDSPDKFREVETVKTEFGAKTMAVDLKTHNFVTDASDFEQPAATEKQPHPEPHATPGTFRMLVYGLKDGARF